VTAGVIMIIMGLAMVSGYMTWFAFWLLEKFPVFGSIG
jgi:cytochrome c-type biogenesis protein